VLLALRLPEINAVPGLFARGDCFWATNKRLKEERERAETPAAATPCCCGNSGDDEEFPPYPEGEPE